MTSYELFKIMSGFSGAPVSLPGYASRPPQEVAPAESGTSVTTKKWPLSVSGCRCDTPQPVDSPAAPPTPSGA